MKTATPFHSDFFNADCLNVEGETGFSLTGSSKVFYPTTANLKPIKGLLSKVCGPKTSVGAIDLSEFPGTCVVQTTTGKGKKEEAIFIPRDTFKLMLSVAAASTYRGKPTAGALYAQEIRERLVDQQIQLILDREAGLLAGKTAEQAVDESILRSAPDNTRAYKDSPLGVLVQTMWEDFSCTDSKAPYPHPTGFGREMAFLLRHGIYSRITGGLLVAVNDRKPSSTIWQNLSDEVRDALTPVILFYAARVRTDGWHNVSNFIKEADAIWPRFNQGAQETKRSLKLSAA